MYVYRKQHRSLHAVFVFNRPLVRHYMVYLVGKMTKNIRRLVRLSNDMCGLMWYCVSA